MIRKHKVLLDQTAATSGGTWQRLDSRHEIDASRAFQISMNASDTITIEATTIDAKDATTLAAVIGTDDITTLQTYTGNADENDVILGPWTYIRATKTGTNGAAKVQGYI